MSTNVKCIQGRKMIKIFNLLGERDLASVTAACDDIVNGYIHMTKQFDVVKPGSDNLWTADPIQNRSWRFWLHTLVIIEHLINGYELHHDKKYLDKALSLLWDWKKHNFPVSESEMAWHDHSTALRSIILCRLFEIWKTCPWCDEEFNGFCELVKAHCQKLSDPAFYMEKHNHGLDQDIALFICSTVFDFLEESTAWRELSLRRFWIQLDNLFAADGSYLEHSPSYIYIFCDRLLKFMNFLEQQGNPSYPKLQKTVSKQLDFLAYILQPDGQIPPIGDGNESPVKLKPLKNAPKNVLDKLLYIVSKGREGSSPGSLDKLFPIGGYAVFRNQWEFNDQTVQVVFYSSFHSRVHKHHDDHAITLFAHGHPLLVDCGRYNFNYQSEERQYVVSSLAHNTVRVDNTNTDISRLNIGKSGLTGYRSSDNHSLASGCHCLYPGISHLRTVLYIKPWNILILDLLQGSANHTFEQVFNFGPEVICCQEGNRLTGCIQSSPCISLSPLLNESKIKTSLTQGEHAPLRGWYSSDYQKLIPIWHGSYQLEGCQAQFATHINLRPHEEHAVHIDWSLHEAAVHWDHERVYKINTANLMDYTHINQNPMHIISIT